MNLTEVLGSAAIAAAVTLALPAAAATYTITELPGANACSPFFINDASMIVGGCNSDAVLWTQNGPVKLGRLPGGTYSLATAINNLGVAVGEGDTGNGRPQIWTQTPTGLANVFPNNGGNTHVWFVGDNGFMGGFYTKSLSGSPSSWHGAIWRQDPKDARKYITTDLPMLPGGVDTKQTNSIPWAFNQSGQAVGYGQTDQMTGQHGVFWNSDAAHTIVDLGTLPGDWSSLAWGVNDVGQAVGESHPPGWTVPVLWGNDAAHTPAALPYPAGDNTGSAHGINVLGHIIGWTAYAVDGQMGVSNDHPVVWRDGGVFDLTSVLDPASGAGWTLTYAASINNRGQIVGLGFHNGVVVPFLMTPQ